MCPESRLADHLGVNESQAGRPRSLSQVDGRTRLSFARSMGPGCCHDLGTTTLGSLCHLGVADAFRQVAVRAGCWRLRYQPGLRRFQWPGCGPWWWPVERGEPRRGDLPHRGELGPAQPGGGDAGCRVRAAVTGAGTLPECSRRVTMTVTTRCAAAPSAALRSLLRAAAATALVPAARLPGGAGPPLPAPGRARCQRPGRAAREPSASALAVRPAASASSGVAAAPVPAGGWGPAAPARAVSC